jgi:hypothetical protein
VSNLNYVAFLYGSHYDTQESAIRFEGSTGYSVLDHVSIAHGLGPAVIITGGRNIVIRNSFIADHVQWGIQLQSGTQNITLDSNVIVAITNQLVVTLGPYIQINAGIVGCAVNSNDKCTYNIINNIVAAVPFAGYVVYGHKCGDANQQTFRNNIAHSNIGLGAVVFPDPSDSTQSTCMQASWFIGYKNNEDAILSIFATTTVYYINMIFVDNVIGPSPLVG